MAVHPDDMSTLQLIEASDTEGAAGHSEPEAATWHVPAGHSWPPSVPKLKRYLAYLPEGPVIDWAATDSPPGSEG